MRHPQPFLSFKPQLEALYAFFNSRKWVSPDPLEFLYKYPDLKDRELVALVASSLAYGRVAQINRSVSAVLQRMGPSPCAFIRDVPFRSFQDMFKGFRHRFTSGLELALMFEGMKKVLVQFGSLHECFLRGFRKKHESVLPALSVMIEALSVPFKDGASSLLPRPSRGSACKRLHLFLRWMVREDRVDPGGWVDILPDKLIIPLDTHMHRFGLSYGLTHRKNADIKTALEMTGEFRKLDERDPVRYDFALTRLGIRKMKGESGCFPAFMQETSSN